MTIETADAEGTDVVPQKMPRAVSAGCEVIECIGRTAVHGQWVVQSWDNFLFAAEQADTPNALLDSEDVGKDIVNRQSTM